MNAEANKPWSHDQECGMQNAEYVMGRFQNAEYGDMVTVE